MRGNSRTRDYVIRREFDLGEGDAYNQVLVDRAERRLNNLGYFKRVRISNEPGSAPDRVVVNVDVEDQSTGAFSISGGYSTSDGFIGEVSVTETNFLGRGQFVRVAGQLGQRANGVDFSFTEPYFLGYRMAAGIDLFSKFSDQTKYSRYENRMTGGQLRLGLPFTEEFTLTAALLAVPAGSRRSRTTYKQPYNDCSIPIPGYTVLNADGTPNRLFCEGNGEASLAIKESQGETLTSLAGLTFNYNTLDSTKRPAQRLLCRSQDGLRRPWRRFPLLPRHRRRPLLPRAVRGRRRYRPRPGWPHHGLRRRQDGWRRRRPAHRRPVLHGPVARSRLRHQRHRPARHLEPRQPAPTPSAAPPISAVSLEVQFPIFGLPRELGLKGAVFADAGTLFGYEGPTTFDTNGNGIIDGFAPTRLHAGPERAAGMHHCARQQDDPLVGRRLASCGPRRSARSASTTRIALTKEEGVIAPTASGSAATGPRRSASRAARASNRGGRPDGALTYSS